MKGTIEKKKAETALALNKKNLVAGLRMTVLLRLPLVVVPLTLIFRVFRESLKKPLKQL